MKIKNFQNCLRTQFITFRIYPKDNVENGLKKIQYSAYLQTSCLQLLSFNFWNLLLPIFNFCLFLFFYANQIFVLNLSILLVGVWHISKNILPLKVLQNYYLSKCFSVYIRSKSWSPVFCLNSVSLMHSTWIVMSFSAVRQYYLIKVTREATTFSKVLTHLWILFFTILAYPSSWY